MHISSGNGGWVRASGLPHLPAEAVVYVRFSRDDAADRLVPVEVYVESPDGERLRGEHLRRLPLDVIEAWVNGAAWRERIEQRIADPSPQLGILASYYAASIGRVDETKRPHWVEAAFNSQMVDLAEYYPPAPRNRPRKPVDLSSAPLPELEPPPDGRYTDEWYASLRTAYDNAVSAWRIGRGPAPANALAEAAGVSPNTVRSWIYRARKANKMPPGSQGRAG